MFKDKETEKNEIEIIEKELNEEESREYMANKIDNIIREEIKKFFQDKRRSGVEDYEVKVDNKDGKIHIIFINKGKTVHTEIIG